MYDTYYENKYIKQLKTYTKYYKMGLIAITGLGLYVILSKGNHKNNNNMKLLENFIHIIPIDKNSKDMIKPFVHFGGSNRETNSISRIQNSGAVGTLPVTNHSSGQNDVIKNKRSVSETKKKYIASQQGWVCGDCKVKLPAWFEVDHIKRLDRGGTNEINNLVALCRNCHGKKTAIENML